MPNGCPIIKYPTQYKILLKPGDTTYIDKSIYLTFLSLCYKIIRGTFMIIRVKAIKLQTLKTPITMYSWKTADIKNVDRRARDLSTFLLLNG